VRGGGGRLIIEDEESCILLQHEALLNPQCFNNPLIPPSNLSTLTGFTALKRAQWVSQYGLRMGERGGECFHVGVLEGDGELIDDALMEDGDEAASSSS